MKRLAILTLLSSPAFAHDVTPETKFFQDEVKRNPMTQHVLTWCSMVGLNKEDDCKKEMYDGNALNSIKLQAATKCVEKSGIHYKVAFDEFFKTRLNDNALVGSSLANGRTHLYPLKGPKGTDWEKEHYHYFTAVDRTEAARWMANDFTVKLKDKTADILTSIKVGGEISVGVKLAPEILSAKLGETHSELKGIIEKAVSEGKVSQELLDQAYAKGEAYGRNFPEATGRGPAGYCFVKGQCFQIDKTFPEDQLQAEVNRELIPKSEGTASSSNQKTSVPETKSVEPFDLLKLETVTRAMPTEVKQPEKPKDKDKESTPIVSKVFMAGLNDCLADEEAKLYEEIGLKTTDTSVKTEEQKRLEAEWELAQGFCNPKYYGQDFCANWERERSQLKVENADEAAELQRQHAVEELRNGVCDASILGKEFCRAFYANMTSTYVEAEDELMTIDDQPLPNSQPTTGWGPDKVESNDKPWSPNDGHKAD